jgi:DNA-binding CsgD family transcriptional regulator
MGNLFISLINLISLILGGLALFLIFRLTQRDPGRFLYFYLFFLMFAVLTGFCDWIIFNWVFMLVPGISPETSDSVYHIFWDLIGFPAYLFAFYYLVRSFDYLIQVSVRGIIYRVFRYFLVALMVLDYTGFFFRIKDTGFFFSKPLWWIYTFILPLLFIIYLAYAYVRARGNKGIHEKARSLILIQLAGFLLWTSLSLLPFYLGESRHMIILAFYLGLFLPVLYLFVRQKDFMIKPEISDGRNMESILKEYRFTPKEIELALLLMQGKSNQEISDALFISTQTVKNYISRMYRRIGVKSRVQFINFFRPRPL